MAPAAPATLPPGRTSSTLQRVAVAPAPALLARRQPRRKPAAPAGVTRSPAGRRVSMAIQTMECATCRTFPCSPLTACGDTTTSFATAMRPAEERHAQALLPTGRAPVERRL